MTAHKPRILHVITRLDPGGSTTNTIVSIDLLRKHGFETFLACGPSTFPTAQPAPGIQQFNIPALTRNPSPFKDLQAITQLKRIMKAGDFDLIHTHTSKAGILGRIAARSCRIPVVHTPHGHIFYGYFGPLLTWLFVFMERMAARHTAKIISLTDIETAESLARGIGSLDQYVTIHSGVPLSSLTNIDPARGKDFRQHHKIPDDAFLFVSIGRLVPVKGFDILLQAFATAQFKQNAPTCLVIVGDGEERRTLEEFAARINAGKRVVIFTGELKDIRPALSAANMFALASRNEGMGRVFIEAMASGLPVIGTAVGGVPSLVVQGKTGMLVPSEDIKALAGAMEKAAKDRTGMAEIGKNASATVYPEYDENTMISRIASLYRELLEKPPNR